MADTPEFPEYDFTTDVRRFPEFIAMMAEDQFCAELWTAFANNTWFKKFDPLDDPDNQVVDHLMHREDDVSRQYARSFRGMGGVIASIRNEFHGMNEDYMDWYCSNDRVDMQAQYGPFTRVLGGEAIDVTMPTGITCGFVTDRVMTALNAIGWFPVKDQYFVSANK